MGKHIREVGMFGINIQFEADQEDLSRAVNDFVPVLSNLLGKLTDTRQGILLILDDINGLAGSEAFANWLKSLVDEIATASHPLPLTLILVGIPERRSQWVEKQPSLDRVFDLIAINPFTENETKDFYIKTFEKVNTQIDKQSLDILWQFTNGYPVFMHEMGDAVFQVDQDNFIDSEDTIKGVFHGIEVIGIKYIGPKIVNAIKSEKYKGILKKINVPIFSRKEILKTLSNGEKKVFDKFLRRMKDLGVLVIDKEGGLGSYRFTSNIYYTYFQLQAREHS